MKHLKYLILILFLSTKLFSQEHKRLFKETALEFANRLKPIESEYRYTWDLEDKDVIETHLDNTSSNNVIFVFYRNEAVSLKISDTTIMIFAYVEISANSYRKIPIDSYYTDDFKLERIYFSNTDTDPEKELVINYFKYTNTERTLITKIYDNFGVTETSGKLEEKSFFLRYENETASDFADRILPNQSKIIGKVVETSLWDNKTKTIIVFYKSKTLNEFKKYNSFGQVFIEMEKNVFKSIYIDGSADSSLDGIFIESVFFVNADKDTDKELAVMYSSPMMDGSEILGKSYWTYIYDNTNFNNPPIQLERLKEFHSTFSDFERKNDVSKAKYKTAVDVKKKLKELGY
ncbi:hypothetical protein [Flavobacterium sp.]|uniref:hypothetical protein n=1 Tax=Flavobacterium sp. TaxID=239 RepID=UPI003D6BF293